MHGSHWQHACWKQCQRARVDTGVTIWTCSELKCSILTFLQCLKITSEIPTGISAKETANYSSHWTVIKLQKGSSKLLVSCFLLLWPCFQVNHSDGFVYLTVTKNTHKWKEKHTKTQHPVKASTFFCHSLSTTKLYPLYEETKPTGSSKYSSKDVKPLWRLETDSIFLK